jgi:hypothetical protein
MLSRKKGSSIRLQDSRVYLRMLVVVYVTAYNVSDKRVGHASELVT